MNDQRPTRWPCSADSSRNAGPAPRSLRKAETGVSQSSTNVWRTGTRLCSRASAATSSRDGPTPSRSCRSAATATEHLLGVGEREAAAAQQDAQVVEQVGGLLGHALVGLLARGAGDLLRLLLDLLPDLSAGRPAGRRCRSPRGAPRRGRRRSAPARAGPRAARAARARRGGSTCARPCGRRGRPARRGPGARRRRSRSGWRAPSGRCRTSRPCARARRGTGSTGAAPRSRACGRAPRRWSTRA